MSLTPPHTYPGVYIQELVSSVKTIIGVPTSITAFIGRALRGPSDSDPDSPVLIHSFADYERIFGGLWKKSEMSYAVSQYFLNGGVDALIVRVYKPIPPPTDPNKPAPTTATFTYVDMTWSPSLMLQAANEGNWGKYLTIILDTDVDSAMQAIDPTIFNLTVTDTSPLPAGGATEKHRNLSLDPNSPQFVKKVLQYESQLIEVLKDSIIPNSLPSRTYPDSMTQLGLPFTCDQTGVPQSPTADNKTIQTSVNTSAKITLTGTDFIPGDILTFTADKASVQGGTVTHATATSPNLVNYTPNTNYHGGDSFTYKATDGRGKDSAPATVTVNVLLPSDPRPPTADNITIQTNTATAVTITLTGTDFIPGDTPTFTIETQGTIGTVTGTPPSVTYTPNAGYVGPDSFAYKATDKRNVASNDAAVNIMVTQAPPADKAPTIDNITIQTNIATAVTIPLTGHPFTPGETLTFTAEAVPHVTQGTVTGVTGTPPSVTYTPNAGCVGPDSFTYKATEGGVDSNIATVNITVGVADLDGLTITDTQVEGDQVSKKGYWRLENADLFNLLCVPPYDSTPGSELGPSGAVLTDASTYCGTKRAMLLVDAPFTSVWSSASSPLSMSIGINSSSFGGLGSRLDRSANAAIFFPTVYMPDLLNNNRTREFAPCGVVAGVIARTDGTRGVWKSPAGIDASLTGVSDLTISLTNNENGDLNPLGINCLRVMPAAGPVVWGSRTLRGADNLTDQWKYLAVRRTALYIEESLYRGIQWVVFEPNDEPLWAQIRLNIGAFMQNLFLQGAFQGQTPKDAYFVKCDSETTTQTDINTGIVNIIVGFAPLKPAEFVILKIEQLAGQGA